MSKFRNIIKKYIKDVFGGLAPLTAVMMPLIMGLMATGVDVSMWMQSQRNMQAAVDAAVIAAAWEIANDFDEDFAEAAALKEAINNGYENIEGNSLNITFGETADGDDMISGSLTSKQDKYFSQAIYDGDIYANVVAATAVIIEGEGYCMLSLDETADGAITAVGNVDVDAAGCGIAVNSNSDSALDLTGNVDINIDSLSIVGDMDVANNVDLDTNSTETGASPVEDPYADLEAPDFTYPDDCDHPSNYNVNSDETLHPGIYCGGISISGNVDVTFETGVYVLYAGDLQITGNGTITAEGVTFILTGSDDDGWSNAEISGGKDMSFTAQTDADLEGGDYEDFGGIVFFQDRDTPDSAQCNSVTGNGALDVTGAIYFPSRCLNMGGNRDDAASAGEVCSQIIAKTIKLHGTPNISNDCDGVDIDGAGQISVRLVL